MSNSTSSVAAKQSDGRTAPPIVDSADLMTRDWFRAVLADAGLLADADVAAVATEPVEGGVIARMVRARLTYAGPTKAPASVVVKFPSDDPGSRGLAVAMGMYELETLFYRDIAPLVPDLGVARCYSARLSENAETFNLVLEDLGTEMRAGNVLEAAVPVRMFNGTRRTRQVPGTAVEQFRAGQPGLARRPTTHHRGLRSPTGRPRALPEPIR